MDEAATYATISTITYIIYSSQVKLHNKIHTNISYHDNITLKIKSNIKTFK